MHIRAGAAGAVLHRRGNAGIITQGSDGLALCGGGRIIGRQIHPAPVVGPAESVAAAGGGGLRDGSDADRFGLAADAGDGPLAVAHELGHGRGHAAVVIMVWRVIIITVGVGSPGGILAPGCAHQGGNPDIRDRHRVSGGRRRGRNFEFAPFDFGLQGTDPGHQILIGPGIALVEARFEAFGSVDAGRQVATDQCAEGVVGGRIKVRIPGHEAHDGLDQIVGGDDYESGRQQIDNIVIQGSIAAVIGVGPFDHPSDRGAQGGVGGVEPSGHGILGLGPGDRSGPKRARCQRYQYDQCDNGSVQSHGTPPLAGHQSATKTLLPSFRWADDPYDSLIRPCA